MGTAVPRDLLGLHRLGQVDREDAARTRGIADSQNAVVGLNAAPTNVEAETEPRSIRAALGERTQ